MKRTLLLLLTLTACTPGLHYESVEVRELRVDVEACQRRAETVAPPLRTQAQRDLFLDNCLRGKGYRKVEG